MRALSIIVVFSASSVIATAAGCGGGGGKAGSTAVMLPRIYPSVRAATPTALIADPRYAAALPVQAAPGPGGFTMVTAALGGTGSMATAVRDRLYTPGPTEILRIVSELDGRTAELDTDPAAHPCLTATPVSQTYTLPTGETFTVKLQCFQRFGDGSGWLAFGFDAALAAPVVADGGADDSGAAGGDEVDAARVADVPAASGDFYLIEGQDRGMGGAYHVNRASGDVEAWIAVADDRAPSNSQVLMHLLVAGTTLELTFAGSGVGFCAAHLRTDSRALFIAGKTNAPPPGGTPMSPDTQYCDALRSGCFGTDALDVDLGGDAAACAAVAASAFHIGTDLDASMDPGANVTPATVYTYFNRAPADVPVF